MSPHDSLPKTSAGRIEFGPDDQHDGLVPRTLDFIREQLPAWRDDPRRPTASDESEKSLNSSLSRFLASTAKTLLPMVHFQHETLQTAGRTVDIGAHPADVTVTIGARPFSIYEPFLVIECKRLPTPGGRRREREYVSGLHENGSPTGGIQRFKLGLHGSTVESAAMIGYVEDHDFRYWHDAINSWINELASVASDDGATWTRSDRLSELEPIANTTVSCDSIHSRSGTAVTSVVRIRHIWLQMQ